jgi:hypothetical protein
MLVSLNVYNTNPDFLASRYALPQELVKNIAGITALIDGALHS